MSSELDQTNSAVKSKVLSFEVEYKKIENELIEQNLTLEKLTALQKQNLIDIENVYNSSGKTIE
jgi:hypothetical protein